MALFEPPNSLAWTSHSQGEVTLCSDRARAPLAQPAPGGKDQAGRPEPEGRPRPLVQAEA
jgi:hypothetical protein